MEHPKYLHNTSNDISKCCRECRGIVILILHQLQLVSAAVDFAASPLTFLKLYHNLIALYMWLETCISTNIKGKFSWTNALKRYFKCTILYVISAKGLSIKTEDICQCFFYFFFLLFPILDVVLDDQMYGYFERTCGFLWDWTSLETFGLVIFRHLNAAFLHMISLRNSPAELRLREYLSLI